MKKIFLLSLLLLLTSCTNYSSYFDCSAHPGAGCQSVSQIEAMIVEHADGEDCYCGSCPRHMPSPPPNKKDELPKPNSEERALKIWICPQENDQGHLVEGHYVYFGGESESTHKSEPQK